MTGTALAVAGLVVLGTLLGTEESGSRGDVASGQASVAQPDTADTGAGQRECAIRPVGGKGNRHGSSEWYDGAHNGPTGNCVAGNRLRTGCWGREAPSVNVASGSDGAAQGVGGTHADTGNVNVTGDRTGEGAESEGLRGSCSQMPHRGFDGPYYTKCMKEPICTNYLYRVSKFWYQKSSAGYPAIVAICLAAIVT